MNIPSWEKLQDVARGHVKKDGKWLDELGCIDLYSEWLDDKKENIAIIQLHSTPVVNGDEDNEYAPLYRVYEIIGGDSGREFVTDEPIEAVQYFKKLLK